MNIPIELRNLIDSEQTDFIIKSKRNYPKKKGLTLLLSSLFWNAFVSIFVILLIGSVIQGEKIHFKSNDVPSGSLDDWGPIALGLFISIFVFIGIGMLIGALVQLVQKGGYFVGTETRFIKYRNGKITIKDWEQFSGNINMKSKSELGELELELRTGKMKRKNKGSDKFVPDIIYISGIKNVFEIEKKCRIRIKENDPTPKITTGNNV